MTFSRRGAVLLIAASVVLAGATASAQSAASAASADQVMARAERQATAEHKNILVMFGASWCGNCHLFDRFLADPAMHPIMDKQFVFVDLATGEQENDKRHANIPGGQKLQASLGGVDAGYPYLAMVDASGKLIVGSIAPRSGKDSGGNIGYPDAPNEIAWFMQMLQKAAPSLSAQERASVHDWLKAHSTVH